MDHAFRFVFTPVVPAECRAIHCFPYVGDDGGLHLWDTENKKDVLMVRKGRGGVGTLAKSADVVRRQWPKLFALGQREGFWKD